MYERINAFLSMHWQGNEDLRNWFKTLMTAIDFKWVEADTKEHDQLPEEIEKRIIETDVFVCVLTLAGEGNRTWVDQEIATARASRKSIILFYEIDDQGNRPKFTGLEKYVKDPCSFNQKKLKEDVLKIIEYFKRKKRELYEKNVGFKILESITEIRFFDWIEKTHKEEYKKKLKIQPLRNGEIKVEIKSGSSNYQSLIDHNITHTHNYEIIDLQDSYHVKTIATIPNARKDKVERIVEKSLRTNVPNDSKECTEIHLPEYPEYMKTDYWSVAFHILYPTELLLFYAEFIDDLRIDPKSIKVIHNMFDRQIEEKDSTFAVTEAGGRLQTLTWEKRNAMPNTDYIILWQWVRVNK